MLPTSRRMLIICLPVLLIGCGGGSDPGLELAPVSGTVSVDGETLAGVTVSFQPTQSTSDGLAPTSFGNTDSDGHYSLEVTTTGQSGAMIGAHNVSFSLPEQGEVSDAPNNDTTPKGNFSEVRTFEVPNSGSKSANFDLTTK